MNREEYLRILKSSLYHLPTSEIEDILWDYEEHFDIGISKGKSEEEISQELGSPRDIARNYKTLYKPNLNIDNYNTNSNNDSTRKLLIGIALIFFNLIIVLGPYLAILGFVFSAYVSSGSFIFAGIALLFGSPFMLFTPITSPHILTSISFGIGLICLGILGIILSIYLTKQLYKLTLRYINWNMALTTK